MIAALTDTGWQRRARPLLGTLVEIGLPVSAPGAWVEAAFAAVFEVQACLSRFEADSDVSRFHALPCGQSLTMRPATQAVLQAAAELAVATDGAFDISLGSGPDGWHCEGDRLSKRSAATRLDVGGIAKGHAVDVAVAALRRCGADAGWVNAGGDLRAFGEVEVPIDLRDETRGGVRRFAVLQGGAWATSHFGDGSRAKLALRPDEPQRAAASVGTPAPHHISVAAPQCLWADALTKVVALCGEAAAPILARYGAQAWRH